MRVMPLGKDGKAKRVYGAMAHAFYAPAISPQTGQVSVQIGNSAERMESAIALKKAMDKLRRPVIDEFKKVQLDDDGRPRYVEPPQLREEGGELALEGAAFNLLQEHWNALKPTFPPVVAEDIAEVDDAFKDALTLTPEQYAERQKPAEKTAPAQTVAEEQAAPEIATQEGTS